MNWMLMSFEFYYKIKEDSWCCGSWDNWRCGIGKGKKKVWSSGGEGSVGG